MKVKRKAPKQPDRSPNIKSFPIVGVGASAGGLEAFTQLLVHLPVDTGMGFVLVQHLDPTHESALTSLLSRSTSMTVLEVKDAMPVKPNHVYVIPPNTNLAVESGILKLQPRRKSGGAHHSIDFFFESLALDRKECSVGVILSGTATDGTIGLEAIKAEGGIVFAQDESAKYDSMPRSAIAAGCVDFVLSPENIAKELTRIAKHPFVVSGKFGLMPVNAEGGLLDEPEDSWSLEGKSILNNRGPHPEFGKGRDRVRSVEENQFLKTLSALRKHSGVDFSLYKVATIERRISRRMVLNRKESLKDYAAFVEGNTKELDALFGDLLIGVTSFFRNPEAFDTLKETIFPALMEKRLRDETVRVWALGCSSGQEPYSIAMAFMEFCEGRGCAADLQIFATDLSDTMLDKARAGLYSKSQVADISPERLRRFFMEEQGGYRINKPLREMCVFARQNILSDPPFSRMDLISCRNLLIYIEAGLQKKIMPTFHYALKPVGFLFLGASESVGSFSNLFEPADKKQKIFRKRAALTPFHLPVSRDHTINRKVSAKVVRAPEGFYDELNTQREADRVTVNQFAPPGVLINSSMEILQFRGATGDYLVPASGKASFDILKMAREGLMLPLRATINKAAQENQRVRKTKVPFGVNGISRTVDIEVIPLKNLKQRCYLILFEATEGRGSPSPIKEESPTLSSASVAARAGADAPRLVAALRRNAELERELAETRDYVQSIQEQYEAANEELQSSSEEVQSANEELQSINEELETSKEELESTNEELTTVNEEMTSRNSELSSLNNDLINLQKSVHTAIVVLGRDLTIRRFTPLAEKTFNLLLTDIGRPFNTIRANFDFPEFDKWIGHVISDVTIREQEVQDRQGKWYILRARPYLTLGNNVDGAVLMLVDIDELKRTEQALKDAHQYTEAIVQQVSPLLILDYDLRIRTANRSFYEHFKVSPKQTLERKFYELGNGQWNIPELRRLLEDILPKRHCIDRFEMKHTFEDIGERVLVLNARQLDQTQNILLGIEDITAEVAFHARVTASEMRYRRLFESAKDGILILDPETRKITDANPFMAELLGYKRGEFLGKELWEIGLLNDEQESKAAFQELQAKNFIRYEGLPLQSKSGHIIQVEFVSNLYREADHVVIQCNIRDITERKQAEAALRESEERYRNLFNSIDEGFCIIEMIFDEEQKPVDYRFLEVNPSFAKQSGMPSAQGKRMRELAPGLESYWFEAYAEVAQSGVPMRFEKEAKALGKWFDVYAFRLGSEQSRKVAVLFSDITQRKQTEEALKKAREQISQHAENLEKEVVDRTVKLRDSIKSLETLTYTMAHDLRAPIRAMSGLTTALLDDVALDENAKEYAVRIHDAAARMNLLVSDLLNYGQLTHLKFPLHRVDLQTEIEIVLAEVMAETRKAHAEIEVQKPLPVVVGNDTLVRQILSNLILNAVKFVSPDTTPKISVHAETREDKVRLWVEDNGIGIAPQYHDKIFGVFQRLHTTSEFPGTGVGLAITKGSVERMDGEVGVESEAGKGSRFWIQLPKG
jgi:two-component system CheB/CheR fusion protein